MSARSLRILVVALLAAGAAHGCGSSHKNRPQEELDKTKQEILDAAKQADFYFDQAYYTAAKKGYEEILPDADNYVFYGGQSSEVDAAVTRAKTRLDSEEMTAGCSGKVFIGGKWVDPGEYAISKSEELIKGAPPDLQAKIDGLKAALKESQPPTEDVLKQEPAKEIAALGKAATPFVVAWLKEDDEAVNVLALTLLAGMEENEDIIFTTAIARVQSKQFAVQEASIMLLGRFQRKETAATLVPILQKNNPVLIDRAVTTLCSAETELGKWYIFEAAKTAKKLSPVREAILKHIYLLKSPEAVEALKSAAIDSFSDPSLVLMREYAVKSLMYQDPLLPMAFPSSQPPRPPSPRRSQTTPRHPSPSTPPPRAAASKDLSGLPETLPAITAVLRKSGKSDRTLVLLMLAKIRNASYKPAAQAVSETFATFAGDKEVMGLAVDAMMVIADQSSLDSVVAMISVLDVSAADSAEETRKDEIFANLTNILIKIKSDDTVKRFRDMLSEYHSKDTIINAARALGALGALGTEAEPAVKDLWNLYLRSRNDEDVAKAALAALARIGATAAMNYVATVMEGSNSPEMSRYLTDTIPNLIVRESAFTNFFADLDSVSPETLAKVFDTIAKSKNENALNPLLTAARDAADPVRLEALRALAAYKDQFKEQPAEKEKDISALREVLAKNIERLRAEPDVLKAKRLFEILTPYGDTVMPVLIAALQSDSWAIRYYSADAMARIAVERPAAIGKYVGDITAQCQLREKDRDYHTALRLAEAADLPTQNLETRIQNLQHDVTTLFPSGVKLGASLKELADKLGTDYTELPSSDPTVKYYHYKALALVFAFKTADGKEKLWGIGYLKGFKGQAFGVTVGQKIDEAFKLVGPPPEDLKYYEVDNVYVWLEKANMRNLAYALEHGQFVRCVAEISMDASISSVRQFRDIMEVAMAQQ